jgi:hypothetical protein
MNKVSSPQQVFMIQSYAMVIFEIPMSKLEITSNYCFGL